MMRFAKPILIAAVAFALATYAADCLAMTRPEQAMECCNSMPCSSHSHQGQDCCKTMSAMHAPFVRPSTVQGVSFSPAVFATLPAFTQFDSLDSSARTIAARYHAPPAFDAPTPQPLRI